MPFEYPAHPNTNRKDPFQDELGRNPFGDEGPPGPASDDPYSVPAADSGPSYHPDEFETTLGHRSGVVLWLGGLGLAGSALGAAGVLIGLTAMQLAGSLLLWFTGGLLVLGVPASWAAWMMGWQDLRAMRAGAMDRAGLPKTQLGLTLGLMGTLLGAVPVVYVLVLIARRIGEEL
jgi:hypothetical protein